ncbi:MAG: winged helix-turn-helix domain-containing protein [Actinomycetota bacterium]|nr:winged helix-turn-helix domain-containing protein [Actinomycetota bacterium]
MAERKKQRSTNRPDATPEEFKAMAHPLRLRILRLCLHESFTNKEIADHLGQDPATTLYHVRTLVRTGFLGAEAVRSGARGALEKPYRATGKSWILAVPRPQDQMVSVLATLDALRAELADAGPDALVDNSRLGLQLSEEEATELSARFDALVQEYAARPATPGGTRYGLSYTLHRLRTGRR